MEISFASHTAKAPSAIQWELTIPAGQLSFVDPLTTIGPAAQSAEKSLSCKVQLRKAKTGDEFAALCILAGGPKSIPNGVVAVLRLQISPQARIEAQRVRLKGLAVYPDLKEVELKDVESTVKVSAK